jgi:hypothetical protein
LPASRTTAQSLGSSRTCLCHHAMELLTRNRARYVQTQHTPEFPRVLAWGAHNSLTRACTHCDRHNRPKFKKKRSCLCRSYTNPPAAFLKRPLAGPFLLLVIGVHLQTVGKHQRAFASHFPPGCSMRLEELRLWAVCQM